MNNSFFLQILKIKKNNNINIKRIIKKNNDKNKNLKSNHYEDLIFKR
jgi:hypothetical protein